ncbi:type III-B CRISPR module RAMP protein Cmr6 [Methylobacter tundripaludum]|uniref:CRISPR-associated RAMP protein, Cmr6 family n=1 Tax=Methylobacter tundripaludum (strain ATCC BAA-1195 / DSM 17260 / SV96) TaxID=697282 RepID=G3IV66_METTV|nr:type III-B CRISPR module RAMP protein Cmr6 [Methylobacter tundripaludum]EGW21679.1 CRISPR-associated RAMP protein, Cmr6 family [Methylobacter tundripaludum SV96]
MLPLYAQIPRDTFKQTSTAHSGLLFDKFPDGWDERNDYKPADNAKKQFFLDVINKYQATKPLLEANLTAALTRQRALLNHFKVKDPSLTVTTDWRFVSGLGAAHPYETGFIWHRTLSVPYLPGSSVKGLMRAWATHWCELTEQQEITRLFGAKDGEANCGALIVFDALPSQPPKLELDILNPHYSEYYQDSTKPPADYLSPKPVFFLTVAPGQDFEFFLAPRPGASEQDLDTGLKLLRKALETLGAGGKTAVGYGVFKESKAAQQKREAEQAAQKQRELQEQRIKNLSPLEIEQEDFLNNIPEQEWDTRLLQELDKSRWTGEDGKQIAEKIKQLMINADKWHPEFKGTNKQKLKYKERSLRVSEYLNE